jgi:hypothetical protein
MGRMNPKVTGRTVFSVMKCHPYLVVEAAVQMADSIFKHLSAVVGIGG